MIDPVICQHVWCDMRMHDMSPKYGQKQCIHANNFWNQWQTCRENSLVLVFKGTFSLLTGVVLCCLYTVPVYLWVFMMGHWYQSYHKAHYQKVGDRVLLKPALFEDADLSSATLLFPRSSSRNRLATMFSSNRIFE